MQLSTTLKGQTIQNQVREVGINPNYWYPVAWANQLKPNQIIPVKVWQQAIAIYRDDTGRVNALENACPHKGVELHRGQVQGKKLVCPYHGWEFDGAGSCVGIPYWPPDHKLPCAQVRSYPVQECYGVIWVFPGEPNLAAEQPIPEVPEYDDPSWLMIPITGNFQAHFSICNENTMDVFHGFLHRHIQGWFNPVLLKLEETENSVRASYRVCYRGYLSKILGLTTQSDGITIRTVTVDYCYPHYHNTLEGVSSLYLMRLPVGPSETRSFSILFLRLPLPRWLVEPIKPWIAPFIRHFVFMRFLEQDVEMMESEQHTYQENPKRRYVEVNPAIIALQRLIVRQYEQYVNHLRQPDSRYNANVQNITSAEATISTR